LTQACAFVLHRGRQAEFGKNRFVGHVILPLLTDAT
jgi:hypothetical protein